MFLGNTFVNLCRKRKKGCKWDAIHRRSVKKKSVAKLLPVFEKRIRRKFTKESGYPPISMSDPLNRWNANEDAGGKLPSPSLHLSWVSDRNIKEYSFKKLVQMRERKTTQDSTNAWKSGAMSMHFQDDSKRQTLNCVGMLSPSEIKQIKANLLIRLVLFMVSIFTILPTVLYLPLFWRF